MIERLILILLTSQTCWVVANFTRKSAPERVSSARQIEKKIEYDWNLNTEQNVLKMIKELGEKFPELNLTRK